MERATGIGGFFFRAKDPEALAAWYERALGIPSMSTQWSWQQEAGPTVFAPFPADTDYFGRREQQCMVNLRVRDLDAMREQLRALGAVVIEATESLEGIVPGIAGCSMDLLSDGSHPDKEGPCASCRGITDFRNLRAKLDGCLSGAGLSKDRAAEAVSRVMIPEALDYPR